jgi:hypothetical protein
VPASLIVYDLYVQNVEWKMVEGLPLPGHRIVSPEESEKAEGILRLAEMY